MNAASLLFLLALGVVVVLIMLGAIGEVMRARLPKGQTSPGLEIYMTRVHSWWAMVLLISAALILGRTGVVLLFALVSFAALREYMTLSVKARGDHLALVVAFYLILPLQFLFVWMDWSRLFTVFVPVYAFLLLPVVSLTRGGHRRILVRVAETQWGLMIAVFCASHIPALMMLDLPGFDGRAVLLIAFLFLTVQFGELLEYFFGKRIGRRAIAPELSPRTWEGAAAGLASAALIGAALNGITPFGPWVAAALAAAATAAGMAGSLVLIAIKRDKGVRDWSHLIPGQGGFLDQMGAVMCAAPVFYHLIWLVWLP